jgi:hypothetical protein
MPIPTFIFPSAPALSASAIYALDVFADKPVFQPESASFTRATTATRTNSSGLIETVAAGIARVDWSGSGAPNTLLEPQRTNLALRSEEFNDASWTKLNSSITANTTTSPDGTTNADSLIENSLLADHNVIQLSITVANASAYTCGVYFKANTRTKAAIQLAGGAFASGGNGVSIFDLSSGTVVSSVGGATATIQNVGNGWYRCTATKTTVSTSGIISFNLVDSSNNLTYTGNGTSGVFLWGAQLELGAYATSYIPTTSTSVTRNADAFTLSNVYTSGKITSAGGTWFVDLRNNISVVRDSALGLYLNQLLNNTGFGFHIVNSVSAPSAGRLSVRKLDSSGNSVIYATLTDNVKIAIKWNGTTADVFANGVKVVSATSFTPTDMQFFAADNRDVPKYINSMALYPTPLLDYQCEMLTGLKFDTYNEMAGYYNYTIQ